MGDGADDGRERQGRGSFVEDEDPHRSVEIGRVGKTTHNSTIQDDGDDEDDSQSHLPWYVRCGRALKPAPCPWTLGGYLRLGFVLLIIGGLVVAFIFRKPIADFLGPEGPLSKFIQSIMPWGPIVYALVYAVCTVCMVPGTILTLAAGVIFGSKIEDLFIAVATISAGSTLGACAAMPLGRTVLRGWVEGKVSEYPVFEAIDAAVAKRGLLMVFLLRLSPAIPFNLLNYMLGLTAVPFWQYAIASWVGMLPGTFMYVFVSWAAVGGATKAASGQKADTATILKDVLTYGVGGVVTIAVVVLVTVLARRELKKAMDTAEAEKLKHDGHDNTGEGEGSDPNTPLLQGSNV